MRLSMNKVISCLKSWVCFPHLPRADKSACTHYIHGCEGWQTSQKNVTVEWGREIWELIAGYGLIQFQFTTTNEKLEETSGWMHSTPQLVYNQSSASDYMWRGSYENAFNFRVWIPFLQSFYTTITQQLPASWDDITHSLAIKFKPNCSRQKGITYSEIVTRPHILSCQVNSNDNSSHSKHTSVRLPSPSPRQPDDPLTTNRTKDFSDYSDSSDSSEVTSETSSSSSSSMLIFFLAILVSAAVLLALCERALIVAGAAGATEVGDAAGSSSEEDSSRLTLLLDRVGLIDPGTGVCGTATGPPASNSNSMPNLPAIRNFRGRIVKRHKNQFQSSLQSKPSHPPD